MIAWLNGPFPAATHDSTVFRMKLKGAIENKQAERGNEFRIIADDGYFATDLTGLLSYRNELDPKEIAYFKDRALAQTETFNLMTVNGFEILKKKFRHDEGSIQRRNIQGTRL